jgi:Pectate lyase superfamily protein
MTQNLGLASIKASDGTTAASLANRFGQILNVKTDFGAVGNGTGDDGPAIQSAFDVAFGSRASPHGNANKYLNRPVFFPPGNYNVGAPLTLFKVHGGHIFGSGSNNTRLTYTGAFTGNDVTGSGGGANAITPLIITDGWANAVFEDINLSMGDNNSTCFYLFWDGTGGAGPTQNIFKNILTDTATVGFLIGWQAAGLCSETTFITCNATSHSSYGYRNISSNALNNIFLGCGAAACGIGFSAPLGSISIHTASLASNNLDIETGQNSMIITGSRTESKNFVNNTLTSSVPVVISGCGQADIGQAGYFVTTGGPVIIDGCIQEDTSSDAGIIAGSGGSVLLRGSSFRNTAYLDTYGGLVMELDIAPGTVASLPTANARYRPLRAIVTDSNATLAAGLGNTVAGSGANIVPVYCDGTNWKIG